MMHPKVEQALEEIDAQLFSGDPSPADLARIEEYLERWQRRCKEFRDILGDQ